MIQEQSTLYGFFPSTVFIKLESKTLETNILKYFKVL